MTFDQWCMELCDVYAKRSKDESTKLGCVIMAPAPGGQQLSQGYNSFARGINDYAPERQVRPEKYKWFVHAEANAIFNAARTGVSLLGGILYCQWLPCHGCAMSIIQAGISQIVVASFEVPERWRGDMDVAVTMLGEAKVGIRLVDGNIFEAGQVLRIMHDPEVKEALFAALKPSDLFHCDECGAKVGESCAPECEEI